MSNPLDNLFGRPFGWAAEFKPAEIKPGDVLCPLEGGGSLAVGAGGSVVFSMMHEGKALRILVIDETLVERIARYYLQMKGVPLGMLTAATPCGLRQPEPPKEKSDAGTGTPMGDV